MQNPSSGLSGIAWGEVIKIVGAFLVGAITVFTAWLKARTELRNARGEAAEATQRASAAEQKAREADEKLKAVVGALPPHYEVEKWLTRLDLESNGSGLFTRQCEGIKPRAEAECRLPYQVIAPSGGTVGAPNFKPNHRGHPNLELDPRKQELGRFEADVVVPAAIATARDLGFVVKHELTQAFASTAAEARRKFQEQRRRIELEYFGAIIVVPADEAIVVVDFPPEHDDGLLDRIGVLVMYGLTELKNEDEIARLVNENALKHKGRTVTLTVTRPQRGMIYAISWMPPETV